MITSKKAYAAARSPKGSTMMPKMMKKPKGKPSKALAFLKKTA